MSAASRLTSLTHDASLDGSGRTYILPDVRGTPMALVDPTGAVNVERYDAFGIEAPDNVGRFGFTGHRPACRPDS